MPRVALFQDSVWPCPRVLYNLQIVGSHNTTSKLWRNHALVRNMPRKGKLSGAPNATEQSAAANAPLRSQHRPTWPELPVEKRSDRSSKPSLLQSNEGPLLNRRNS